MMMNIEYDGDTKKKMGNFVFVVVEEVVFVLRICCVFVKFNVSELESVFCLVMMMMFFFFGCSEI